MEYETSYDTGLKPFNHDKNRGKWTSAKDFFFACAGHAFKVEAIMITPFAIFEDIGIVAVIPYLLLSAVCVVPIVFIQSFLGQFSGTGFISVFRISPLFKGIGYVSLLVNFVTLTYYSVFSAIPLFHFFHSLRPTIPWSCDGAAKWMKENDETISFCAINSTKTNVYSIEIPSVQFFINHLNVATYYNRVQDNSFSIELMLCTWIIWAAVAYVILKSTDMIGRFLKYSFLAVVAIMSICLLRFVFLEGASEALWTFLFPSRIHTDVWLLIPSLTFSVLGPGWGSILTMASFNNFKTDIFNYSWVLCLAQIGLMIGMALLSIFVKAYMDAIGPGSWAFLESHNMQWLQFLSIGTGLTFLELPHFWSLLFFSMWILGSLNILIVQLLSLMTSIFDEFEELREVKRTIILGAVAIFAMTSVVFCTNHGVYFFGVLSKFAVVTQVVLNLLLLLIVLWIYGRERFQRDLNFMTSRIYSTWMVYVVRFVAPLILLFGLLIGLVSCLENDYSPSSYAIFVFVSAFFIFFFSWCLIPGYCIFKIKQTTGLIGMRLKRCIRPTDWYPADPVYKQRYEETFNTTDISHNLTTESFE